MPEVRAIQIADGQYIYVEVDGDVEDSLPKSNPSSNDDWRPNLPEHASPTGPVEDVVDAMKSLQQNIKTIAESVHASFHAHQPEEWTLELNIGFKGKASPIPVILSGEATGAIKVTAKWLKTT